MFRAHIGKQGGFPRSHIGTFAYMAVEVAIGALGEAEGPVNVEGFGQGVLSLKIKPAPF